METISLIQPKQDIYIAKPKVNAWTVRWSGIFFPKYLLTKQELYLLEQLKGNRYSLYKSGIKGQGMYLIPDKLGQITLDENLVSPSNSLVLRDTSIYTNGWHKISITTEQFYLKRGKQPVNLLKLTSN